MPEDLEAFLIQTGQSVVQTGHELLDDTDGPHTLSKGPEKVFEVAMPPEFRLGSHQVLDLLAALGATGLDAEAVCREVGLAPVQLHDQESVAGPRVLALLDAAERWTGDPYIGLHAGERSKPSGPLAFLLLSCAGLEQGIRQVSRFVGLTISTLKLEVESEADRLSVIYDLGDDRLALHRHMIDYLLLANLHSLWRASGERFPLREVRVRFPDLGDDAEARAFGCPVHFGQADTRWVIDARELRRIPPLANPIVAEQIEIFSAALLARLSPSASLQARVADATRRLLANGVRADRAQIARRLGMSDRTLRRGLEGESTTFKQVRDTVLWDAVSALLSNPALKTETIALSTGFSDLAAFSKAFKRWAGCTPTMYRRRSIARGSRAIGAERETGGTRRGGARAR